MVTWHLADRLGFVSRMPLVAMTVTTAITWLQFLAAQGLAVLLLSSTIGEEIRKGTLGALLTTPITSLQIVVGKLLGRMLHVLVLLAISLPVLAILRLFGGVPAGYVLAGACVTLTTALSPGC
jgi:ABC-type transport system involved in multi-copper enzyme maturation permease subunit